MTSPDHALLLAIRAKTRAYMPPPVRWPELHGVGVARVLDFGGGFGVHYRQAVADMEVNPLLFWAVVERPEVVALAAEFENGRLKFFSDIAGAMMWLGSIPDLIHSNGALQYSPRPCDDLAALVGLSAPRMIWKRITFSPSYACTFHETQISRRIHHGPGKAALWQRLFDWRHVRHRRTLLSRQAFLRAHNGYRMEAVGDEGYLCTALRT